MRTEKNSITIEIHARAIIIKPILYMVRSLILNFLDLKNKNNPRLKPKITILNVDKPMSQSLEEKSTNLKSPF